MGAHASKQRLTEIFEALDEDHNGSISTDEVMAWVQDEQFLDNPEFKGETVKDLARALYSAMDTNKDGKISKEELIAYFSKLKETEVQALTLSLTKDKREKVLAKIFDALDTDHSRRVTKDEVVNWMKNERFWQREGKLDADAEQEREQMWKAIDQNADSTIEFKEFAAYFSTWPVRRLRASTEGLLATVRLALERKEKEKEARDTAASHMRHVRIGEDLHMAPLDRPEYINFLPNQKASSPEAAAPSTSFATSSSPPPPPLSPLVAGGPPAPPMLSASRT